MDTIHFDIPINAAAIDIGVVVGVVVGIGAGVDIGVDD